MPSHQSYFSHEPSLPSTLHLANRLRLLYSLRYSPIRHNVLIGLCGYLQGKQNGNKKPFPMKSIYALVLPNIISFLSESRLLEYITSQKTNAQNVRYESTSRSVYNVYFRLWRHLQYSTRSSFGSDFRCHSRVALLCVLLQRPSTACGRNIGQFVHRSIL